jgi:hypothetical protein
MGLNIGSSTDKTIGVCRDRGKGSDMGDVIQTLLDVQSRGQLKDATGCDLLNKDAKYGRGGPSVSKKVWDLKTTTEGRAIGEVYS